MPFRQYWVFTPTTPGPSYLFNTYLFRSDFVGTPVCTWQSVEDHLTGPSTEQITFECIDAGPDFLQYSVELLLAFPLGVNVWRQVFTTARPEPEGLVEPNAPTSCSRIRIDLPHVLLGSLSIASLLAAYPDACDDADYPAKVQRKFFAAF